MKKFLIKSGFFILPFIIIFLLNTFVYNREEGDLVRLGYLYYNPSPKSLINNKYNLPKHYTLLSEIDLTIKNKFDVITIGDSFSELGNLGYKNFIGSKGLSVLHIDAFITGHNPIQTLIQLIKSDFFNFVSADYVVLQSVERYFNKRTSEIDFGGIIRIEDIKYQIDNRDETESNDKLPFFSEATLKIPFANILYFFNSKIEYTPIFKYKTNHNNLFSNSPNQLLLYEEDIYNLENKNDSTNIFKSIKVIEGINDSLTKHNINLIMLVSPDKYDIYYPFIEEREKLTKPQFFEIYEKIRKNYLNVNAFQILSKKAKSEKDIYFYDDTHWSPKSAEIIADEIYKIVNK